MPIVYLLRHCEYANPRNIVPGRLPLELSEAGVSQAEKLRHFFADKNIGRLYSSAVRRCQQTAKIIAGTTIPIEYDQRLLETLSAYQGYWGENETPEGYEFFLHRSELGGEGLVEVQQRMVSFWEELKSTLTTNVIICSHGDPLMVLHYYMYGLPLPDDNVKEVKLKFWLEKGEFQEILL